jgi:uncharacterized protein
MRSNPDLRVRTYTQAPRTSPREPALPRPGWQEVFIGLTSLAIVGFVGGAALAQSGLSPVVLGLTFTALSGVAGMLGFLAAFAFRLRSWTAFGIRATTWRWLIIGTGLGVVAFVAKGFAVMLYTSATGDQQSPQSVFLAGASGGFWTMVTATFLLGVVTPIGEEFLFRGVLTTVLLRYGALVGVLGGALVFALFHGISTVFPAALVAGLFAGEVFRRSGSIWPGVMVHVVFNLPTIPMMVMASTR